MGAARQVGRDVQIGHIEPPIAIERVAFLGDGERDQPGVGMGEAGQDAVGRRGSNDHFADSADDAPAGWVVEFGQGVETVLGFQRVADSGAVQRHRRDRPARIVLQNTVEIAGLVRAMEGARTEMDDADVRGGAVVGGARDTFAHGRQRGVAEASQRVTPRFQMAISRSPLSSFLAGFPDAVSRTSR